MEFPSFWWNRWCCPEETSLRKWMESRERPKLSLNNCGLSIRVFPLFTKTANNPWLYQRKEICFQRITIGINKKSILLKQSLLRNNLLGLKFCRWIIPKIYRTEMFNATTKHKKKNEYFQLFYKMFQSLFIKLPITYKIYRQNLLIILLQI